MRCQTTSGASTLSDVVGPVKSGVKPGVPTDVFGVSADSAATVGWTAPWKPALNGRAAGTTTDSSGSIQYYTVYPDPMPQSTCGDAGDWSKCSAPTAAAACDAESSCSWDTAVVEHPALRGDVYGCSSGDQPRCDDFDRRTDVGGRDGGDEFSEVHHGERWRDCCEFWCWGQGGSIDSAWAVTM